MIHYTFFRESNDFKDILSDISLKKHIHLKLSWYQHLILAFEDIDDSIRGYIMLKYGDEVTKLTDKDYTPVPNVDYKPIRR